MIATARKCRRSLLRIAASVAAMTVVTLGVETAAAAQASAGPALITRPGTIVALRSGGSQTPFAIALPSGARCPGDATKPPQYVVQSYLVPKGTDPVSLHFTSLPDRGWFFVADGRPFAGAFPEKGTGRVLLAPEFNVARFRAPDFIEYGAHSAEWEGGIGCSDVHGTLVRRWGFAMTFSTADGDPGGFTWSWAPLPRRPESQHFAWPAVIVAGGLIAGGAAAIVVVRRRRGHTAATKSVPIPGADPIRSPVRR